MAGSSMPTGMAGWPRRSNEQGTQNNDPARRKWTQDDKGILTLQDGRQLYINHKGWAGVALAGEATNNDDVRKVWKINRPQGPS